jgi:hypothetical protein
MAEARLTVVLVLPLPPLLFDRVIIRTSAITLEPSDQAVEEVVRDRGDIWRVRKWQSGAVSPGWSRWGGAGRARSPGGAGCGRELGPWLNCSGADRSDPLCRALHGRGRGTEWLGRLGSESGSTADDVGPRRLRSRGYGSGRSERFGRPQDHGTMEGFLGGELVRVGLVPVDPRRTPRDQPGKARHRA